MTWVLKLGGIKGSQAGKSWATIFFLKNIKCSVFIIRKLIIISL